MKLPDTDRVLGALLVGGLITLFALGMATAMAERARTAADEARRCRVLYHFADNRRDSMTVMLQNPTCLPEIK